MASADDLLLGGGSPTAKFTTLGTVVKGTIITDPETTQQTDINGNPLTWDNGDPKMQIVVTLQTDERDPSIEDDDGVRKLYVNGGRFTAVKAAVRAAGIGLRKGGTLAVKYASDGTPSKAGFNPPKQYVAQYQPPAAADALLGATDTPAAAAPVAADDLL